MRYCPSIGLGLGLSLRSQGFGLSYVKTNRVLDLANLGAYTIVDQSPEGNDATLYTGRYASTDGVTDKAINADCSAAGSGNYYMTGKIKPVGTTAVANLDGSPITLTGLTAGVWQDFTSDTKTGITPDDVVVGWNGASNYSAADWSDVKLINAATGATVARWQLNDSSAGNLNGYPALDSSGNGYHGSHVGCAGGTGETTILQTAGLDWNKYSWFNGTNTFITTAAPVFPSTADFDETLEIYVGNLTAPASYLYYFSQNTAPTSIFGLAIAPTSGRITLIIDGAVAIQTATSHYGKHITIQLTRVGTTFEILINGVSEGAYVSSYSINQVAAVFGKNSAITGREVTGLIYGDPVNGTESGTFTRILAPASDATPANDALGNAIANPRVNNSVLNLFGDGEYGRVPASASLDTGKTVSGWVYYGGVAATFLDLGTPTISSSGGSLTSSGFTAPTYHVNGVSTAGLGAAGWKHVMVTSTAALATDNWDQLLIPQGKLIGYSDVKVTADALQNYNAQKAAFGL